MIDAQSPPVLTCTLSTTKTQKEPETKINRRDSGFSESPISPLSPSKTITPTHARRDSGISMMDSPHEKLHHEDTISEQYHSETESEEEHWSWSEHVHLRGGGWEIDDERGLGGQRELGEKEIERRMLEVHEEDEGLVDDYGRPWIL